MNNDFDDKSIIAYPEVYCGFKAVASSFNVSLTDHQDLKLRYTTNAIGVIDKIYDECISYATRREISDLVLDSLRRTHSAQSEGQFANHTFGFWFGQFYSNLSQEDRMAISVIAKELFALSEADRITTNSRDLARSISSQGALTAKLILTAIGVESPSYSHFMTALGAFTNLLDSIWDAEPDYKNKQVIIFPSTHHYFALWLQAASILPSLFTTRMFDPFAILRFWSSFLSNLRLLNSEPIFVRPSGSSIGEKPD